MSTFPIVTLTATILDAQGSPVPEALITFKLLRHAAVGGVVLPTVITATTDVSGVATAELCPYNTCGSPYAVTIRAFDYTAHGVALLPDHNCSLEEVFQAAPYPEQTFLEGFRAEMIAASTHAQVATASAVAATAAAGAAEDARDTTVAARDESESFAATAKTDAETAKTGAVAAQILAAASAIITTTKAAEAAASALDALAAAQAAAGAQPQWLVPAGSAASVGAYQQYSVRFGRILVDGTIALGAGAQMIIEEGV